MPTYKNTKPTTIVVNNTEFYPDIEKEVQFFMPPEYIDSGDIIEISDSPPVESQHIVSGDFSGGTVIDLKDYRYSKFIEVCIYCESDAVIKLADDTETVSMVSGLTWNGIYEWIKVGKLEINSGQVKIVVRAASELETTNRRLANGIR